VADIETEDPDVQWIPNPGLVAVMVAEEEAVPLTADDIAAVNVAPERTPSTDDERPAASYPLLDRRRYQVEESISTHRLTSVPLAIGTLVEFDEYFTTEVVSLSTEATFAASTSSHSGQDVHPRQEIIVAASSGHKKRKRKAVNVDEDPEEAVKNSSKKEHDDDKDPKRHPLRGMSGRRHSGLRYRL
jgi:hypothetical protein